VAYGDLGNDLVVAGTGADLLYGGEGNDSITADAGADTIQGNQGNDSINAGSGGDVIYAGQGDDTVVGGADNDVLVGDKGNDRLVSDGGTDTLTGGEGNDTFVFSGSSAASGIVVSDFQAGLDKIDLTAFANIFGPAQFVTASSFSESNNRSQFRFDSSSRTLLIDSNGDATAELTISLTGVSSLSASDFTL
jgi:Ca2+-binding RTX toxin-like protein